jgi:hypothetical protein
MAVHENWEVFKALPTETLRSLTLREAQKLLSKRGSLIGESISRKSVKHQILTPFRILQATLACFKGHITLDPASDGKHVPAKCHYTEEVDGLSDSNPWFGSIFIHPPHLPEQAELWVKRLAREVLGSEFVECILLLPHHDSSSSLATLLPLSPSVILPLTKLEFVGKRQPTLPFILAYVGKNHDRFSREFSEFGPPLRPAKSGAKSEASSELPNSDKDPHPRRAKSIGSPS